MYAMYYYRSIVVHNSSDKDGFSNTQTQHEVLVYRVTITLKISTQQISTQSHH